MSIDIILSFLTYCIKWEKSRLAINCLLCRTSQSKIIYDYYRQHQVFNNNTLLVFSENNVYHHSRMITFFNRVYTVNIFMGSFFISDILSFTDNNSLNYFN
jgi:hypothetical protein